jgi:hypothetical protein
MRLTTGALVLALAFASLSLLSCDALHPARGDVGATLILAPVGTIDSGTVVTPQAVVRSFKTSDETFRVTFNVGAAYSKTVTDVTLAPDQTDTVSFPSWTAEPEGDYVTMSFTGLAGDENRHNDTAFGTDTVKVCGVVDVTLDISGSSLAVFTGFFETTTNGQTQISGSPPKSYTFQARKQYDIIAVQLAYAGVGDLTAKLVSDGVTRDSATIDTVGTLTLNWIPK